MRERMLSAWILRALLLLASAVAIAAAAILGPGGGNNGDVAFRLLLFGIAFYVVSRILDKR